jgi:hypothetical protein
VTTESYHDRSFSSLHLYIPPCYTGTFISLRVSSPQLHTSMEGSGAGVPWVDGNYWRHPAGDTLTPRHLTPWHPDTLTP